MKKKQIVSVLMLAFMMLTACAGKSESKISAGMKALENLEYEIAEQNFEAALAAGENAEQAYRGQGMAYLAMARYEDSIGAFERALAQSNGIVGDIEYDISYYLAVAQYKNGDAEGAYDTYSAMIALDDENAQAYYLRGSVALKNDRHDDAILDFDKAISLTPKDYDLYIRIYEDLLGADYKSEGDVYLRKALGGDTKMSIYQQGKFYYYLGQYEDARNSFEKASGSNDTVEMILFLGKTYEALGDANYAASLYSNFLEKHTDAAEVYNQLGLCKIKAAEYSSALEAFEKGIAIEDNAVIQSLKYNEIVAYEYLTDYKKATVLMEAYLKVYPDDKKAIREYEFLKTR